MKMWEVRAFFILRVNYFLKYGVATNPNLKYLTRTDR